MQTIAEPATIVGNNGPTNSILKSQDYYFSLDFKTAENELGKVKDYLRDNGVSNNTPAIQTTKELNLLRNHLRIIWDALKVVHRMQCC